MIRNRNGFTMVELLVVMTLTVLVLAASSRIMVTLIAQFKQQSTIAEATIESTVGLEMLRFDIKTAGFGLPWDIEDAGYTESMLNTETLLQDNPPAAPRALIINSGDSNEADFLVIKSIAVGRMEGTEDENDAAGKWHSFIIDNEGEELINAWNSSTNEENLNSTDKVVVHSVVGDIKLRNNGTGATDWYTTFGDLGDGTETDDEGFHPVDDEDFRIIYGLMESGTPLIPYYAAGYYIDNSEATRPARCADNTGVLMKSVLDITSNTLNTDDYPLLDCVADMQVIVGLDGGFTNTPNDIFDLDLGGGLTWADDCVYETGARDDEYCNNFGEDTASEMDAEEIRERAAEVRVYILAHEGQKDPTYTYPNETIDVGDFGLGHTGTGAFHLANTIGSGWDHYRWKIYKVIEIPSTLRGK